MYNKADAVVIGGGAAGMFAAGLLARGGMSVTLIEKNEKLGKKLFITGKGRCNFTNDCDRETFFASVVTNPRFLYSSYGRFTPQDMIAFLEKRGLRTKVERGRRVFPYSDHAYDVTDTLKREMKKYGVQVLLHCRVTQLLYDPDGKRAAGVRCETTEGQTPPEEKTLYAPYVIVATGGLSYPATGSTGDGYTFAENAGHTVTERRPSLVPLMVRENELTASMAGLSLKNAVLSIYRNGKKIFDAFGELLFTHQGISGPVVLTASAAVSRFLPEETLTARIDLKPAVDTAVFDKRLDALFKEAPKKAVRNVLHTVYPSVMIGPILCLAGIEPAEPCSRITKNRRAELVALTKAFPLTVVGTEGFSRAVITQGGVNVKEIDPSSMRSKFIPNLYFAGEVLDLDALTGGFNLQIAWMTAYAAAQAVLLDFGSQGQAL